MVNIIETECRRADARRLGEKGGGVVGGYRVSLLLDERVPEIDGGDDSSTL